MRLLLLISIAGIILLLALVKPIFGSVGVFKKAILGHVFSDFSGLEIFKKWERRNGIHHRMHLFYAVALGIVILSFVMVVYWV